jgi:D-lactate dehydrogenase
MIEHALSAETADRAKDAEVVSTFINSPVGKEVLDRLPNLRLIATRSTGFDHIDVKYANEKGITVANVPAYGENTVAEQAMGLILTLSRKLHESIRRTKHGHFYPDASLQGFDLKGKTLGVIGTGRIGSYVAKMGWGFSMNLLGYDIVQNPELVEKYGLRYVDLDALLSGSDVITIHAPYLPSTHHMINRKNIDKIKKGAILINTARGAIVETQALVDALDSGILAGAGLDVLEEEGLIREDHPVLYRHLTQEQLKVALEDHILLEHEKVVVTPHNAFNTKEGVQRIIDTTVKNIKVFSEGAPVNVVQING